MSNPKPTLDYQSKSKRVRRTPANLAIAGMAVAVGILAAGFLWRALHPPDFTDAPVFNINEGSGSLFNP